MGYSIPLNESDTIQQLTHTHTHTHRKPKGVLLQVETPSLVPVPIEGN